MMANPWSILGLEPDTADEKQVRSAYARLLKVYRPDQDPEGFQRLRTAYQLALEWVQKRATPDPDDWADDDVVEAEPDEASTAVTEAVNAPPPLPSSWAAGEIPILPHELDQEPRTKPKIPQRPERDWPREWSYSLESLDCALKNTDHRFDSVSLALNALALDVLEFGIPPFALGCIIKDAFQDEAELFGITVPVTLVSWLLQGGYIDMLKDALDALAQAGNPTHIILLVQKLDECLADTLSPVSVDIFFHAAGLVALHEPFIAKSIVRRLRRLLDGDSNLEEFDRLHDAIMRGMALRDLLPEHRNFWSQQLDHPDAACDWKADLPDKALIAVVILGKKWVGYPLTQGVRPAEVWKQAWKRRWFKLTVHELVKTRHSRYLVVGGFAVIGGVLLIAGAQLSTEITPAPRFDPTTQSEEFQRNYQRGVELLQKHLREKQQKNEKDRPNAK